MRQRPEALARIIGTAFAIGILLFADSGWSAQAEDYRQVAGAIIAAPPITPSNVPVSAPLVGAPGPVLLAPRRLPQSAPRQRTPPDLLQAVRPAILDPDMEAKPTEG